MNPLHLSIFLCVLSILGNTLACGASNSVTVSTFVAAPTAHYHHIWMHSIADLSSPCNPGTIFFSTTQNDLIYCQDNGVGTGIGTYYPLGGGIWKKSGNYIFPTATASNPNLQIGIGTSVPTTTLDVNGAVNTTDLYVYGYTTVTGATTVSTVNSTTNSITANTLTIDTLTVRSTLWCKGNGMSASTWVAILDSLSLSDQRFKTDIKPLTNALAAVLKLNPVTFNWLDIQRTTTGKVFTTNSVQSEKNLGLLAQDVYKIVPEAVIKPKNDSKDLWSISYPKLIPLLIQAIKEHKTETDALRLRLAKLQKRLQALASTQHRSAP